MTHLNVFVYGSLKKGYSNSNLLNDQEYLGEFKTLDKYSMVSLGTFPGVFLNGGSSQIQGELYEVSQACMDSLDQLEGYPNFYDRVLVQIENSQGDIYVAWIYYLPSEMDYLDFKPIPSGNWEEQLYWS